MGSLPRLHGREKRGRHSEKKKESLPSPLHSRAWSFALDGLKMKREAARSITLRAITKILLNAASVIHPASRGYIFAVWDGVPTFRTPWFDFYSHNLARLKAHTFQIHFLSRGSISHLYLSHFGIKNCIQFEKSNATHFGNQKRI